MMLRSIHNFFKLRQLNKILNCKASLKTLLLNDYLCMERDICHPQLCPPSLSQEECSSCSAVCVQALIQPLSCGPTDVAQARTLPQLPCVLCIHLSLFVSLKTIILKKHFIAKLFVKKFYNTLTTPLHKFASHKAVCTMLIPTCRGSLPPF